MVSKVGKDLLKNMILHTGSHNKRVEMADMWQQKETSKTQKYLKHDFRGDLSKKPVHNQPRSNYHDDENDQRFSPSPTRENSSRKAHMDDEPSSTFWMRELQKVEENDPDRWGHGGYKEFYPHEFDSDRSDHEKQSLDKSHKDKRKKHKVRKKAKKRKYECSESDSTESSSDDDNYKRKRRKCKHAKDENKISKRRNSASDSEESFKHRKKSKRKSVETRHGKTGSQKVIERSIVNEKSRTCAKKSKHKHKSKKKHKKQSH